MAETYDTTDEATRRLAKKRQLAQLLEAQSMKGLQLPNPNVPASWTNALSQLADAYVAKKLTEQADTEGKAYEKEQSDAFTNTLADKRRELGELPAREDQSMQAVDYENQPKPGGAGDTGDLAPAGTFAPKPDAMTSALLKPSTDPSLGDMMLLDQSRSPTTAEDLKSPLPYTPDKTPAAADTGNGPSFKSNTASDLMANLLLKPQTDPSLGDMALLDQGKSSDTTPEGMKQGLPTSPMIPKPPMEPPPAAAGPGLVPQAVNFGAPPGGDVPFKPMNVRDTYNVNPNRRNLIGDMGEVSPEERAASAYADAHGKMAQGEIPPEILAAAGSAPPPPGPIPPMPRQMPAPPPSVASLAPTPMPPAPVPPPVPAPIPPAPVAPPVAAPIPPAPIQPAAPAPLPNLVPTMNTPPPQRPPMLPAQAGRPMTTMDYMDMVSKLPPGQMKSHLISQVMQEAVKEPLEVRKLTQQADIEAQKSRDTRYGDDVRAASAEKTNATTLEAARIRAAAMRTGNLQMTGLDVDNTPVSYNPHTGQLQRPDGSPPKGAVMSVNAVQKEAGNARTIDQSITKANDLLKVVADNKGAFGGWGSAGINVAGIFGEQARGWVTKNTYTDAEQVARATVAAQAADILHQLYGAALTKNEEARANKFIYSPGEAPEVTINKINAMMQIIGYKQGALSPQAQGAIRTGSGRGESLSDLEAEQARRQQAR